MRIVPAPCRSLFAACLALATLAAALVASAASAPLQGVDESEIRSPRGFAADLRASAEEEPWHARLELRALLDESFPYEPEQAADWLRAFLAAEPGEALAASAEWHLRRATGELPWDWDEWLFEMENAADTAVSFPADGIEVELVFRDAILLDGGGRLEWTEERRAPYVAAMSEWLAAIQGVHGAEHHRFTLSVYALPFGFGNGAAQPDYDSLVEVGDHWLPTSGMMMVNSFFYEEGALDVPWIAEELRFNALHEFGHAFGIGSLWNLARYEDGIGMLEAEWGEEGWDEADGWEPEPPIEVLREWLDDDPACGGPVYRRPAALARFREVYGDHLDFVPISRDAGHLYAAYEDDPLRWFEGSRMVPSAGEELMAHGGVLSAITLGFLEDLGYRVDYDAAEPFLPERHGDGSLPESTPIVVVPVPADDPFRAFFTKQAAAFGVRVLATEDVPDRKLLHAASVLAEYLDNDEDGAPDDARVIQAMLHRRAALVMTRGERQVERLWEQLGPAMMELGDPHLQDLYASECRPEGAARQVFDATYEEVWHLVSSAGYSYAYPEVFAERPGTKLADAMDLARGGRFWDPPETYPSGAWYRYDDPTCDYPCQAAEYLYWGVTSLLGAQAAPWRFAEIRHEWLLNTPEKLAAGDPALHALLTDARYHLPTRLPDGDYDVMRDE